jgi:hypothetical protein
MQNQKAVDRTKILENSFNDVKQVNETLKNIVVPDAVKTFAGKLQLLETLPANYLIPLKEMLPTESIRFFYIDQNWINSLMDGMYSIGRLSELDTTQDAAYYTAIQQAAWTWVQQSRPEAANALSTDPITGFILHSSVVKQYPSMQVHAYSGGTATAPTNEIPLLRLDHLSDDTIIGLFSGTFQFLAISKPPEMLHFGFEIETTPTNVVNQYTDPSVYVMLRSLVEPVGTETGNCIGWGTDANGRVAISQLAEALQTATQATEFSSAQFALEMIHGADTVVFINNPI